MLRCQCSEPNGKPPSALCPGELQNAVNIPGK
ncbi:protein of unknown function [Cyanobium sp. NIES-981]|nr:protein of unknown function [Cyanobium sp. NIES-981]